MLSEIPALPEEDPAPIHSEMLICLDLGEAVYNDVVDFLDKLAVPGSAQIGRVTVVLSTALAHCLGQLPQELVEVTLRGMLKQAEQIRAGLPLSQENAQ